MRLLVCGGRDYDNRAKVFKALDAVNAKHGIDCIIEGRCPFGGADRWAQEWSQERLGYDSEGYPMTGWRGPERNSKMLRDGNPDAGVAFGGNRGTGDMVRKMRAANVPVWEIDRGDKNNR